MASDLITRIKELAREGHPETVSIRRHIHQHPELSGEEEQTAQLVEKHLEKLGIPQHRMANTGVVGLLEGNKGNNKHKKTIALRADMDALPLNEQGNKPYTSVIKGVMHACGHDAHTAILLGAARILKQLQNHLAGNVLLIFQPYEEKLPGGAVQMLEEGLFDRYKPEKILGLHVDPELKSGTIGMKAGAYMASADEIYLEITGQGGHGATPHKNTDTILLAAQTIVSLQQVTSRNAPPATPTVLSFGRIMGDGQTNIIPNRVNLSGTFRTFDEIWRTNAHQRIQDIAHHTAKAYNGTCQVTIKKGYPTLINHPEFTNTVSRNAAAYLTKDKVLSLPRRMTAEDFAYFARQIPGCFFRLGIADKDKGIQANLHTPQFDISEKSLETGTGIMTWLTMQALKETDFS